MLDFIEQSFITFLNMSITGSYIIAAIILIRLMLKKAPKIFSYALWAVAGLRLLCPFSFSSVLSIFNLFSVPSQSSQSGNTTSYGYVPQDIATMQIPEIETGIAAADTLINPVLPSAQVTASVNPMQTFITAASVIWIIGIAAMAVYGIISLAKIKRQIQFATKLEGNIFECDKIRSPFVLGVFSPKIYLPCGMQAKQKEYVILHEKNHIRRFDHITKLISFAVLTLHWYNPLVWVGYNLMVHDMEMSCDESVLRKLGAEAKKAYSFTLVTVGANKKLALGSPLSFGENGVEKRVVNILNFKKPKVIAIIACVLVCIIAAAVFLTNAVYERDEFNELQAEIEDYLELDFRNQTAGNGNYKYDLYVAGAKVVEISEDKSAAYGWQRLYNFDIHYSELIRYENQLSPTEIPPAGRFKATLDENGKVIDVELIEETIPELPETIQYDFEVRERAYQRAGKQLKALYSKIRVYDEPGVTGYSGEGIDGDLTLAGLELADDSFGEPVLVARFKCDNSEKTYRISSHYDFAKKNQNDTVPFEAKTLSSNDSIKVPSGKNAGREVLYFAELSKYVDTIEKGEYRLTLYVHGTDAAYEEVTVDFTVDDNTPSSFSKPKLTYESLDPGYNPSLFEAVRGDFTKGTMHINYAPQNVINLTEDNLEEIQQQLENAVFTFSTDSMSGTDYHQAYVFGLTDENGRNYSFCIYGNKIKDNNADIEKDDIELNSTGLFNAADSIYQTSEFYNPPTSAEISTDIHGYIDTSIGTASLYNTEPSGATLTYLVSDVVFSSPVPEFSLWSLEVSDRFITVYLGNGGSETITLDEDYTVDKLTDGEWQAVEQIREHNIQETTFVGQNEYGWLQLPVEKFFINLENGRYRLHLPIYIDGRTEATVEFTVAKYMITRVPVGQKITGTPVAVSVKPQRNSNFSFNQYSAEEISKIAELYNSMELEELPRGDMAVNQLSVSIIDNKGYEYYFEIEPNGSVNWNYYTPNGDELYAVLMQHAENARF